MENILYKLLNKSGINDLMPLFINDKKTEYWCYFNNKTIHFCDSEGNLINKKELNIEDGIFGLEKQNNGYYFIPKGKKAKQELMLINRNNELINNKYCFSYCKLSSQYYILDITDFIYKTEISLNDNVFFRIIDTDGNLLDLLYRGNLSKTRFFISYKRDYFILCDEKLNEIKTIKSEDLYTIQEAGIMSIENNNICLYNKEGILQSTTSLDYNYHTTIIPYKDIILVSNGLNIFFITACNIKNINIQNQIFRFNLNIEQITDIRICNENIIECSWENSQLNQEYFGHKEEGYLYFDYYTNIIYTVLEQISYNSSYYRIYALRTNLNNPISDSLEVKKGIACKIENNIEIIVPPIFDKIINLQCTNDTIETIAIQDDITYKTEYWKYYKQKQCILEIQTPYQKQNDENMFSHFVFKANNNSKIVRINDSYIKYIIDDKIGIICNGKVILKPEFDNVYLYPKHIIAQKKWNNEWVIKDDNENILTEINKDKPIISVGISIVDISIYFPDSGNLYSSLNNSLKLICNIQDCILISHYWGNFIFKSENGDYILVNNKGKSILKADKNNIISIDDLLCFNISSNKFFTKQEEDCKNNHCISESDYEEDGEEFFRQMNEDFPDWGWNID